MAKIPEDRMDKFSWEPGDLEIEHSLCSYCRFAVGENADDCAVYGKKTHTYKGDEPCPGFVIDPEEEEYL